MKILKLFLFVFCLQFSLKAQVVFCPAGAEWRYIFNQPQFPPNSSLQEKITYVGDTVVNGITCKKLKHTRFYRECNAVSTLITVIRQSGDTIYMRGQYTNHSWQLLYNFACTAGQSWTTEVSFGGSGTLTYTTTVDSVKTILDNGNNLRRMYTGYSASGIQTYKCQITERYGNANFLFSYFNDYQGGCTDDVFSFMICYKDNETGTRQFTNLNCDFSSILGLDEFQFSSTTFIVYPNPSAGLLHVKCATKGSSGIECKIYNPEGLLCKQIHITPVDGIGEINTSDLSDGLYILNFTENGRLIGQNRFVQLNAK